MQLQRGQQGNAPAVLASWCKGKEAAWKQGGPLRVLVMIRVTVAVMA